MLIDLLLLQGKDLPRAMKPPEVVVQMQANNVLQ
jgi:hypothetical protein